MAQNDLISGLLTYEKRPVGQGHRVLVDVTGTLKTGDLKIEDQPDTFASARHEVCGEQVYDLELRDWVSGKLKMKTTMIIENRKLSVKSKEEGTMHVCLERLPKPQTGPAPWESE